MNTQLATKYESRTINTQAEFGDLVEISIPEMRAVCDEAGWDFSRWNPKSLADYMRPENFPGCPAAYDRAVRRFADAEDVESLLKEA